MFLPSLCCCLPSAGIDHSSWAVQSHVARCWQGATSHPRDPQWSLKDCPDIPCQHGRNESLHYNHPTWDQWQMGTCEFFPALQGSGEQCHCSNTAGPGNGLFTLQLPSYAEFSGVLSFGFGSIAMYLESGRDLWYKCLRHIRPFLHDNFKWKLLNLKVLRFLVFSWPAGKYRMWISILFHHSALQMFYLCSQVAFPCCTRFAYGSYYQTKSLKWDLNRILQLS